MPIVFYKKETDTKAKVMKIHNQPDLLSSTERAKGIEITEMPIKEQRAGKKALPYINPETAEVWYEYVDRPLTEEERLDKLEKATGVNDKKATNGIASRLDDLESRIEALEK